MNHPLCLVRRLGSACVFGALAVCVVVLACAVPAQAAVDLVYFEATGYDDHVLIEWATAQEMDHAAFKLYREYPELGQNRTLIHQEPLNPECIMIGCDYSYEDYGVEPGVTYYYWLESLNLSGGSEFYGPVAATPGPLPTATSTSAPMETATSTPTATPTSTPTRVPTATPTLAPTATPSSTSTTLPTSTPTTLPTATAPPTSTPEASPTFSVEQLPSPTATAEGSSLATATPSAVPGQVTPTPTATSMTGSSDTSPGSTGAAGGDSQAGTSGWSSLRLRWPTLDPSTILLFVSLVAAFGVLLLSVALALVRKHSL